MKKLLFSFLLGASFYGANSQVLFQEDFDGIGGPTAGGAGTYTFPSGFMLRNVDNRTPAANVNYVNDAWERREDFQTSVVDSVAFATSWYTPAGGANDWMWTPLIGPLPANAVLSWNAKNYDPTYLDGYEVRIMTAPTTPTGGTGVIGNQITNSTVLYSNPAEVAVWTARSVSLNTYAGQSVYIGFRLTSTDKFLLVIDDIKVEVLVNHDARIVSTALPSEYTQTPVTQTAPLNFSASINNNGILALTNVQLNVNVFNSVNTNVYSASSTVAGLAASATSTFTVAPFTPSVADDYTVRYHVSATEADQTTSNDTTFRYITVTDSTYARDNGVITGGLGIGAGNGGYLGQDFLIVNADDITSVSMYFTQGYTGRRMAAAIWDMSAGAPNAIIAGTDTLLYPDDSARIYTLPIHGGFYNLAPGRYAITAIEFDSTLSLGQTADIYIADRGWVDWPTNAAPGWSNPEDFGVNFARASVLRPNFGCTLSGAVATSTNASCNGATDGTASIAPTGGTGPYSYVWMPSGSGGSATNLGAGTYSVTVADASGCMTNTTFVITEPAAITGSQTLTLCAGLSVTVGTSTYTATGVYSDVLTAANGCDSIVTTNLTVSPAVDVATSVAGSTITANATPATATFLWLDCDNGNAVISGETGQSYSPVASGNYAVLVTENGCSDTSACVAVTVVGLSQQTASNEAISVFPNPSSGAFVIKTRSEGSYTIYNELGQVVKTIELNAKNNFSVAVNDLNNGVYMISGVTAGKVVNQRIVIKK
ncbi:MAG: hypothetical protein K0S33_1392 [Bacteroidetes bacterium]|nr:hypothetical protein [Bacteroidota bacterium]